MNRLLRILFLASVLSLTGIVSFAQDNFASFSKFLAPEKLYLQTDRDVYCAGDTVWFKGYLRNASAFSDYAECNYIYVELFSTMYETDANLGKDIPKEELRARVKVKRNWDGIFSGYIPVPENLSSGIAVLRGYSYWMLNKDADYMFNRNIEIRNPLKDDYVKNLQDEGERTTAKYTELGVANPFNKEKQTKRDADVQFLPESGRYLADVPAVFGIKAVGEDGLGVEVSGTILADNEAVAAFNTNSLGFAKVSVIVPEGTSKLVADIKADGISKTVTVQKPDASAAVIKCDVDSSRIKVNIVARGLDKQLTLVAYDRSEIYFTSPVDQSRHIFEFPYSDFEPGINNFAVVDAEGNVYAERAFFICPTGSVQSSVRLDKAEYGSKEKASGAFSVSRTDGKALMGDFSVAVTDDGYSPYDASGYNIVSWMYLGSELKTFVEDSRRYFDESRSLRERLSDADLLMLTQGWKYYDIQAIMKGEVPLPLCGKEYTQSIAGRIIAPLGKTAKKANISFVAPSIRYTCIHQLDSLGYFNLNNLDFPQGTQFLVSAEGLGGNRYYTPVLDNDIFAKYHEYAKYQKPAPYDINYKLAAMPEYYAADGTPVLTLASSRVTANRTSAQKNLSPFPQYEFKPGQYRTPEQMKPYETWDIPSYVTATYPSVRIDTTSAGEIALLCRTDKVSTRMTISSGWEPVIIYIDRVESTYEELLNYTVADLEGFAYISGTDALKFNTWQTQTTPRSVLMVKLRQVPKTASNLAYIRPFGWEKPAKTYTPVYDTPASKKAYEPIRPTLYWNPDVVVDESGKADFDFYTSSHFAPGTVVIEGMTYDGVPVFCTGRFDKE